MNRENIPIASIDKIKKIFKIKNVNKKQYSIVLFKMDGCGYCEQFQPIYNKAKEIFKYENIDFFTIYNTYSYGNENLIDLINSLETDNFKTLFIPGYPTIAIFESDPEFNYYYFCEVYEERRDLIIPYIQNLLGLF